MRSDRFTITVPTGGASSAQYATVSTVGTGLAGIAQDAPCVLNLCDDLSVAVPQGGGDAVPTVRVSATDELRVRIKGLSGGSFDAIITEL
jgi:hypothetical protein